MNDYDRVIRNTFIVMFIQVAIAVVFYIKCPDYVYLTLGISMILKVFIIFIGKRIAEKYE